MKKTKKKFKNIERIPNWASFIFVLMIKCAVRCLFKIKKENPHNYIEGKENFIIVTWHNRLLFLSALFSKGTRTRTKAIVSASRDGQYTADFVHQFGLKTLRGSSSRQAISVQRQSIDALKEGWHVCFASDGSRGPKYQMQRGAVHLASLTGSKIVPVVINASRYWQLNSWDRFQIPKPFCTLTLSVGDAIEVPEPCSDKEDLENWRKKVEDNLMKITIDKP